MEMLNALSQVMSLEALGDVITLGYTKLMELAEIVGTSAQAIADIIVK